VSVNDRDLPLITIRSDATGTPSSGAPGIVSLMTARTVQGMARVGSGQAPA